MIIFLDIDGVLLPRRMYLAENQTEPIVTVFDPGIVGLVNSIAKKLDAKFVIHSSWLRTAFHGKESVKEHMISQGLNPEYFHKDDSCSYRRSGTRWDAILDWLDDHPEVGPNGYWILEDENIPDPLQDYLNVDRIIQTDFDEGLTFKQYLHIIGGCSG